MDSPIPTDNPNPKDAPKKSIPSVQAEKDKAKSDFIKIPVEEYESMRTQNAKIPQMEKQVKQMSDFYDKMKKDEEEKERNEIISDYEGNPSLRSDFDFKNATMVELRNIKKTVKQHNKPEEVPEVQFLKLQSDFKKEAESAKAKAIERFT